MRKLIECAPCRAAGHFCLGVLLVEAADGDCWVCLDCADGEPCVVARCGGAGRDGSNVAASQDVFGQMVFAPDVAPVVTRTPEELGIPRTVASSPPVVRQARPERTEAEIERARAELGKAPLRMMKAGNSEQGAGSSEQAARVVAEVSEERAMPKKEVIPQETVEMILAEPATVSNMELSRQLGLSEYKVRTLRLAHGIRSEASRGKAGAARLKKKPPLVTKPNGSPIGDRPPKVKSMPRTIEVDPTRPGTASSLFNALAKVDAQNERMRIELDLTVQQIGLILNGLSPAKQAAFLSAGLVAALTA